MCDLETWKEKGLVKEREGKLLKGRMRSDSYVSANDKAAMRAQFSSERSSQALLLKQHSWVTWGHDRVQQSPSPTPKDPTEVSSQPTTSAPQTHPYLWSVNTLFFHKRCFCLTAGCWKWKGLHIGCLWEEGRSHQSHVRRMHGHWETHSLCL